MVKITMCSKYAYAEPIPDIIRVPNDAIFVPTEIVVAGGVHVKICKNNDYYRLVSFYKPGIGFNWEVKEEHGKPVDNLLTKAVNYFMFDDDRCILKLSGNHTLKAFIPEDTFYVQTGENEARVRIQTVEPGLYYATIYNVRGNFINYEGFMVDEKGRNADEAIKEPKNFRFAWDYIVLEGGYWLVKKLLSPEEMTRLEREGKITYVR